MSHPNHPQLRADSDFACTSCAACCKFVRGPAYEPFKAWGWIMPDGSCKNLDHATKSCKIYNDRPNYCRADSLRPAGITVPQWHSVMDGFCDESHMMVYGEPRERGEDCTHTEGLIKLQLKKTPTVRGLSMDKLLEGMTAGLCVPTYGNPDVECQKSVRAAVMKASNSGLRWKADVSPNRVGWSAARNIAAQWLYGAEGVDGLIWIDSDMDVPADSIVRLLDDVQRFNADFVSGVYHQRMPFHNPVFYIYNELLEHFQPAEDYPENEVVALEKGGCGFGFVWTSRKLIRAIHDLPSFTNEGGWFPDTRDIPGGLGEDLGFCKMAMETGTSLYVDTGIQLGHVGDPKPVTREDFSRERKNITKADVVAASKGWKQKVL